MFKLHTGFREDLTVAYRNRPVVSASTGKRLSFSVPRLLESLKQFALNELKAMDDELFMIYSNKMENKNKGLGKDTYYRLFTNINVSWSPSRDLIDLLFYYTYEKSYEQYVAAKMQEIVTENIRPDEYLLEFQRLKTQRLFRPISEIEEEKKKKLFERILAYLQKKFANQ